MFCYYCGNEMSDNSAFCPHCGRSVDKNNQQCSNNQNSSELEYRNISETTDLKRRREADNNNKTVLLWVFITVLVLIICVLVTIILINKGSDGKEEHEPIATQKAVVTQDPTQKPAETEKPVFERTRLYRPSYTYDNFNDIHSSFEVSDKTAFEIEGVIEDFNEAWIDFVNNYDMGVYDYLREGTPPYGYAKKYEEKSLTQRHDLLEVLDVRESDYYYYAWVHEIINEQNHESGKEQSLEYHWVYKIGLDETGYYIAHYIKDPAYK